LVYTDIDLLNENMNTIKKNTDSVSH